MFLRLMLAVALWVIAAPALAQQPARAPIPAWVTSAEIARSPEVRPSPLGLRMVLFDQQVRFDQDGVHAFFRGRYVVTSTQGLRLAGLSLMWDPSRQTPTVHGAVIRRGDEVIDLLSQAEFEVIRREQNVEQAVLDGVLTAIMQPRGVRVGDELEFTYTITTRDPVLGDHLEHMASTAFPVAIDTAHFRASWPADMPVRIRGTGMIDLPAPVTRGGWTSVTWTAQNHQPVVVPQDVPTRFTHVRQIELTDYGSWSPISALMAPLYDRAARIDPESSLMAAVEAIRAAGGTPEQQVEAALRLVQSEVRYFALGMGEGGLVPATAEETWRSRFGDCKAKTALLMAILRELGFEAEAALVSVEYGDGLDARLPVLGLFDHVIVRTVIGGRVLWLDGTRQNDRDLTDASSQPYGWALPVRPAGADLERLPLEAMNRPSEEKILKVDMSAGLDAPSAVDGVILVRGPTAADLYAGVTMVSDADLRDYLSLMWAGELGEIDIASTDVAYEEATGELRLSFTGRATLPWRNAAGAPRRMEIPNSRLMLLADAERAPGPFADAPVALPHPSHARAQTVLILPNGGEGFSIEGEDVDGDILGRQMRRTTVLSDGVVTTEAFIRTTTAELPIAAFQEEKAEADALNQNLARIRAPANYRPTEGDLAAQAAATPNTVSEYVDRAWVLQRGGDVDGALAALDAAVALDPTSANALANRGLVRVYAGDLDAARIDLDRAADLDPSEVVAMNGRGLLYMADGEYEDAVIEFSRSIRYSRGNVWALGQRANAYVQLGEHDKALADVDAMLVALPGDRSAALLRVAILWEADRRDEALAAADALLLESPDDVELLTVLADLRVEHGDAQAALDLYDRAVALAPEDGLTRAERAKARLRTGDMEGADADLAAARAAAIATEDAGLLNSVCWNAALANHRLEQALLDCDAALALSPESAAILDSRGMVLLRLGRFEDAIAAYDAALAKAPTLVPSLYGRGLARAALGDAAGGQADIEAALAIRPRAADDFRSVTTVAVPAAETP